jgi:hypothetical protein
MFRRNQLGEKLRSCARLCRSLLCDTRAAALMEFAVSLPLLVVLTVGIFDFGGAFNLKQELNNATREGARFAANQPTNDLNPPPGTAPPSVDAVRYVVDAYLQTAHINDCGLSGLGPGPQVGGLAWHYTPSVGCSLTLTIDRGVVVQETPPGGGPPVNMMCTKVNIVYPYTWHFNSVIQLLVPGASFALTNIQTESTAVNMN